MTIGGYFSGDYEEARAKFLDACGVSGIAVESHQNRSLGPEGEALFVNGGENMYRRGGVKLHQGLRR